MPADVYWVKSRPRRNDSPSQRFTRLMDAVGLKYIRKNRTVAVKIHFGEEGATGYIHPTFARTLVRHIQSIPAKPFLTDTNTLYRGDRSNGVDHLALAVRNGYSFTTIGAPIVIADGIRSRSVVEIPAGPKYFSSVKIGAAIWEADSLICMNHFKGHLVAGFGGAIKNLSMGCGSRATKQRMHADLKPEVSVSRCVGCGECREICPTDAITIENSVAQFDLSRCIGCAECLAVCPEGAIRIQWDGSGKSVQEKMAETALAVTRYFHHQCLHFNFLLHITPECDCLKWTDNPIVQDIGILASYDPVAVDQAALDLVTEAPGLPDSALGDAVRAGQEKFSLIHPGINPADQLVYGEQIGLGSREYNLIPVD